MTTSKWLLGFWIVCSSIAVLPGCASGGFGSAESLDNIQQQLLGDMPLPQGSKISNDDRESDVAAIVRTIFWIVNLITCFFIIANTIRHW